MPSQNTFRKSICMGQTRIRCIYVVQKEIRFASGAKALTMSGAARLKPCPFKPRFTRPVLSKAVCELEEIELIA